MTLRATAKDAGSRLDQFLARSLPEASRAKIQRWIEAGCVRVNGEAAKPSARLRGGEQIAVESAAAEALTPAPLARAFAEEIPLDVLYEDEQVVAINKPAGMTVHAGAGVTKGTLVNALLHHFRQLSSIGGELRPGIVHRLDRFTSGVLLVAKTDAAHVNLARQFAARQVRKTYWALVHRRMTLARSPRASITSRLALANARRSETRPGALIPSRDREGAVAELRMGPHTSFATSVQFATGSSIMAEGVEWRRLEMPIRRDSRQRVKMTARAREGRAALTDFRVLEEWPHFSLLEVRIGTGRTHQIRVHLSTIGHPVVGDALYGAPRQPAFQRFFLHAREIVFTHPATGKSVTLQAPLPPELEAELAALRQGTSQLVLL